MSKTDQAASRLFVSCLAPTVLAAYPHSLALNDPPGGYPVVISSFGTSSGFVLPSGSGTVANNASITGGNLVLTPNAGNKAGIGLYGNPVAVGAGVQVEFTYTSTGGSGADGIAFFVLDASQVSSASAVVPGGYGGGLGYADDGRTGITGGVLGIGFDTFGNFSAADQGPQTGTSRLPNSIDIRGAGNAATSGYALLNTTAFAPGIDGTRTAKVTLIPNGTSTLVSVAVSTDGGKTFTTVINSLSVAQALPSSVYYGFSASTGGSTDLHEINAMAVQLLTDPEIGPVSSTDVTTGTNNPSTIAPGDSVTYNYSVVNNGPNGSSQLVLTDDAPSNLVGETYTIVDSLGTHTGTGAPDVGNLNLSSGATATVSVSGTVDIHATSGNLSHVITVVPGSSYASSNPAGGTVTANIGGTSSSLFLQDADTASAITGASATVLLAPAAVVVNEAGAAHTVNADVHETNTALGTLALASGGPLTGTYDATTGDLRFSGTAAQVQAEMRDVEFVNVAHTGSSPLVTQGYTFTLTDATTGKQAVETRAATSIASPSASGPVGGSYILDTGSDSPFSAVSVSEPNAVPLTATVTVNAANGDFSAATASGWSRSASGTLVTYTRTYSASGTVAAAVQAGLQSLSFQPVEHAIAPRSSETDGFSVMVADAAGTGTPVLSGADTVTAVHDLPSVSGAVGGQSVSDETLTAPFATTVVADPDDTSLVVVVSEAAGHGDFMTASTSGWSRSTSGGTVSYTETFAAAPGGGAASAANAAIQALTFQPTAHALPPGGVEQNLFSFAVTDGLGSAAASGTGTVTVTAVHDTPVLTNPTGSSDISDTGSVLPYASATVVDPDNTPLTLTVTVA
ncbi:MAG: lectin-like domain-containing protein, partial [Janthinobacterium lividum]